MGDVSPFISVIIVAYNAEKTLQRTLDAIRIQTFRDFEIVFVNNGATDGTGKIMERFMAENHDIPVNLISIKENKGLQPGRMAGLQGAKGEYILLNDADDWMMPKCLELLAEQAKKPGIDKVMGAFVEINENDKVLRTVNFVENQNRWLVVNQQAVLFSRKIIQERRLVFHPGYLDDIDFNSHYNEFSSGVSYVTDPVFYYYVDQNSTSGAKNKNRPWTGVTMVRDTINLLKPLHDRLPQKEDRLALEYLIIKQYYFYLLHNYRYSSLRDIISAFEEARQYLLQAFPDYLKMPKDSVIRKIGDRPNGKRLVSLLRTAERCHMLNLLLWGYLIVSKFTYVHS